MAGQSQRITGYPQILLAEDDPEMRDLLEWVLHKSGYDVTECRNGLELLQSLRSGLKEYGPSQFDLVVADVQIPVMGPIEILKQLGGRQRCPPVVLITAFANENPLHEALQFGVAAVIDKPFDTDDLVETVEQLIAPRKRNQRSDGGVPF